MRWYSGLVYGVALLGGGRASKTSVVHDAETGFTFSEHRAEYAAGRFITFRVAVPSPAPPGFDLVLQIVASFGEVGWAGLAWGGAMLDCPLAVAWGFGELVVGSLRRTSTYSEPQVYTGATLQVLTTGTDVNETHWRVTAKCSGCSSFVTKGEELYTLDPDGSNRLAFAYSTTRPSCASTAAGLSIHDGAGAWLHDFSGAGNVEFEELVQRNA